MPKNSQRGEYFDFDERIRFCVLCSQFQCNLKVHTVTAERVRTGPHLILGQGFMTSDFRNLYDLQKNILSREGQRF